MNDKLLGQQCTATVIAVLGKAGAQQWWGTPNKAFNMLKPRVVPIEMVYAHLIQYAKTGKI